MVQREDRAGRAGRQPWPEPRRPGPLRDPGGGGARARDRAGAHREVGPGRPRVGSQGQEVLAEKSASAARPQSCSALSMLSALRRLSRLNPPTIEGNDRGALSGASRSSRSQTGQTGRRADQVLGQIQALTRATRREQPRSARR